jgi:putative ABC transport system substrate-binding protein
LLTMSALGGRADFGLDIRTSADDPTRTLGRSAWGRLFALPHFPPGRKVLGFTHCTRLVQKHMRRREFITLLGGAAATWPQGARAQQAAMPVVGFMSGRSADAGSVVAAAFRQGLNEAGFVADRNVAIEYRWAADQLDRLPAIAAELVSRPVSIIAVFGTVPAKTVQAASTTIPIVFLTADDPVTVGLVANLNRPGGNVTGVSFVSATLGTKRLELLRALAPKSDVVAVLLDPHSTESQNQSRDVQEAAGALGVRVVVLNAGTASEIDSAFATLVQQRVGALLVSGSPTFGSRHKQLVALAARHALPTMYATREYSAAGGLISYGASILDSYRQAAIYVGRILKGDRPSDLPVLRPTKFELVINLKTAKALGLDIPDKLLALADEVIE